MSWTVNDIITRTQAVYPDLSQARAATLGTQIRAELFVRFPILRDVVEITNLVAGTRQYALNVDLMFVDRVEYYTSASVFTTLVPTDYDYLNDQDRDFKTVSSGTPTEYFLLSGDSTNGPMIGLNPAPDTSSSGSPAYPRLKVYGSKKDAFTAGGTIYDDMPNSRVYETGIAKLFAEGEDAVNFAARAALYDLEVQKLDDYWKRKNRHLPETINK